MEALASSISCSTDLPFSATVASRASRSAGLPAMAALAIFAASSWKPSFFATKSVSQFSSTRTPADVPSSSAMTRPFAAVRSARLPASLTPFLRSSSMASSMLPSASASAFLQSIMPAPDRSRSRLMSAAEKFAIVSSSLWSGCQRHSAVSAATSVAGSAATSAAGSAATSAAGSAATSAAGSAATSGTSSPATSATAVSGSATSGAASAISASASASLVTADSWTSPAGAAAPASRSRSRSGDEAVGHRVGDHPGQQRHRADRVVVARDRVGHLVRVAVRVEDRDHRDAQLARLVDRDVLLLGVHHPDGARHPGHVPDPAERLVKLVALALEAEQLLLRHAGARHVAEVELLELLQPLQPLVHGGEVGEHPAQPALVHV